MGKDKAEEMKLITPEGERVVNKGTIMRDEQTSKGAEKENVNTVTD